MLGFFRPIQTEKIEQMNLYIGFTKITSMQRISKKLHA